AEGAILKDEMLSISQAGAQVLGRAGPFAGARAGSEWATPGRYAASAYMLRPRPK
ncbi:unnamed protein product, partial [marine sediment metagenome]